MKKNIYYPSSDGVTKIHGIQWIPDCEVRAVLQICHGMVEYVDRYDRFARFLNQYGICVVGNDHLGHGESVVDDSKHGYFKEPDGNECVIRDINRLRRLTAKKYPDLPYFMMGHSMGSFLIRQYMMLYGEGLSGVIVMGTGRKPDAVLTAGKLICRAIAAKKGWEYRSKFVDGLAFFGYNKRFEPARTPVDWLTKDEAVIDGCIGNPWSTFMFTLNGFYQMLRGIQFIQKKENIRRIPKDLPIFFVAGMDDPVGEYGRGVEAVYESYRAAGIKHLKIKLYEKDRHELLNETDYEVVSEDLKNWLESWINP